MYRIHLTRTKGVLVISWTTSIQLKHDFLSSKSNYGMYCPTEVVHPQWEAPSQSLNSASNYA
jgi:hypothetical protein